VILCRSDKYFQTSDKYGDKAKNQSITAAAGWSYYLVFIEFYGAPTRTRTADLLITNQLLYQLSYRGRGAQLGKFRRRVKIKI
jgi:hypothetical protein